jgi:hypothetical protein
MTITINGESMTATVHGQVTATAMLTGGHWSASNWPHPLTRNQAITALMIAEFLATGHGDDDPFVLACREELTHG